MLKFDQAGTLVTSFGAGLMAFPHGIHIDRDGNVWVTDSPDNLPRRRQGQAADAPLPAPPAKVVGHQVFEFSLDEGRRRTGRLMPRRLLLLVVLAVAAGSVRASAGDQDGAADRAELARLESVWDESHVRGDSAALDRLWAEDFTAAVPGMRLFSKAELMALWRSGRMTFRKYQTSAVRIRVYGDAAVATGRVQRTRDVGGQAADDDWQFTKTYVRRDGAWKVVAFHASPYTP